MCQVVVIIVFSFFSNRSAAFCDGMWYTCAQVVVNCQYGCQLFQIVEVRYALGELGFVAEYKVGQHLCSCSNHKKKVPLWHYNMDKKNRPEGRFLGKLMNYANVALEAGKVLFTERVVYIVGSNCEGQERISLLLLVFRHRTGLGANKSTYFDGFLMRFLLRFAQ